MRRCLKKLLCVLMILALALPILPAMASGTSVKVNSASAKIYKSASTASASAKLKKGLTLTLKDVDGDWAKVSYSGKTGYVPVKYLTLKSSITAYISESTHLYKSASSSSERTAIAQGTKVEIVGMSGSYYQVKVGSVKGYVRTNSVTRTKPSANAGSSSGNTFTKNRSRVVKLNWFNGGSSVLKTGSYGYIYDIDTGITVKIKRMGGHNHADVEPATKSDTAKLLKIAGGTFSWESHAVILHAGGKYVACAINTLPHGDQTLYNNGYDGQFCLHMTGSLTHGSESVNEKHQASIDRAYSWAHS